jgi:hypothetical protein
MNRRWSFISAVLAVLFLGYGGYKHGTEWACSNGRLDGKSGICERTEWAQHMRAQEVKGAQERQAATTAAQEKRDAERRHADWDKRVRQNSLYDYAAELHALCGTAFRSFEELNPKLVEHISLVSKEGDWSENTFFDRLDDYFGRLESQNFKNGYAPELRRHQKYLHIAKRTTPHRVSAWLGKSGVICAVRVQLLADESESLGISTESWKLRALALSAASEQLGQPLETQMDPVGNFEQLKNELVAAHKNYAKDPDSIRKWRLFVHEAINIMRGGEARAVSAGPYSIQAQQILRGGWGKELQALYDGTFN